MDVDQPECKRHLRRVDAGAEPGVQRGTVQPVAGIGDSADGGGIDLDPVGVVDERVLFLADGAAQPRTDHIVVAAAIGIDRLDELGNDPI